MRKAMFLLAVFGLVGSLRAADPAVGTWKLNVAKSRFSPILQAFTKEAALKEETIVIRELGTDAYELTATGTHTDGSPLSQKWTVAKQGGILKYQQGAPAEGIIVIFTKVDAYSVYFTPLLNGKQLYVNHSLISKDGKMLQNKITGADAQSKPFEQLLVFDKQ